jgi:hypothetical protein
MTIYRFAPIKDFSRREAKEGFWSEVVGQHYYASEKSEKILIKYHISRNIYSPRRNDI